MTLHEAIEIILKDNNRPMKAYEIANEINAKGLYLRKDGREVPYNQIYARVRNYSDIFKKDEDGYISIIQNKVKDLIAISEKILAPLNKLFLEIFYYNH